MCVCSEIFKNEKKLNIIIGIDYLPYEFVEIFEELTGIEVSVDIFDSNEILEAKLLAGSVKYDLVFPAAWPYFSRQLKAGIYRKIDKSRISVNNFDPDIMRKLAIYDSGNDYALPYIFGIFGIGINEKILNKINPENQNGLSIIFDPESAKKFRKYRISISESAGELFPLVLSYLKLNPMSENASDYIAAAEHLGKIRKYIMKFTPYGFEDLASDNAYIATSTASDINRVNQNRTGSKIKFIFPKEGGAIWVEVAAIPVRAEHLNNIYAFLKFLFHPKVIAHITNKTSFANAVTTSSKFIDPNILNNKDIYPDEEIKNKCYIEKPMPSSIEILRTRLLTKIKAMDGE